MILFSSWIYVCIYILVYHHLVGNRHKIKHWLIWFIDWLVDWLIDWLNADFNLTAIPTNQLISQLTNQSLIHWQKELEGSVSPPCHCHQEHGPSSTFFCYSTATGPLRSTGSELTERRQASSTSTPPTPTTVSYTHLTLPTMAVV